MGGDGLGERGGSGQPCRTSPLGSSVGWEGVLVVVLNEWLLVVAVVLSSPLLYPPCARSHMSSPSLSPSRRLGAQVRIGVVAGHQ